MIVKVILSFRKISTSDNNRLFSSLLDNNNITEKQKSFSQFRFKKTQAKLQLNCESVNSQGQFSSVYDP